MTSSYNHFIPQQLSTPGWSQVHGGDSMVTVLSPWEECRKAYNWVHFTCW